MALDGKTNAFHVPELIRRWRNAQSLYYTMFPETARSSGIRVSSDRQPCRKDRQPDSLPRQTGRNDRPDEAAAEHVPEREGRGNRENTPFELRDVPPDELRNSTIIRTGGAGTLQECTEALSMLMTPTANRQTGSLTSPTAPNSLPPRFGTAIRRPIPIKQRAAAWMKAIKRPVRDVTVALEAIAWAEGLPLLMKILGSEDWLALSELLSSLPADVDQQTLKDQPLVHQLLAGELAWTLATRLPHTPFSRRLERSGRAAISLGLEPDPGSPGHACRRNIFASSARSWPAGPVAGRWPRSCRAVAWGPGPNNATSGSCGMPYGVLVPMAGPCWLRMTWGPWGREPVRGRA